MSTEHTFAKRLIAEGVVITLSILVAFSIDAWWDLRQEGARIQAALVTLEAGFSEHISRVDERLTSSALDDRLLYQFVNMDPGDAGNVDPDSSHLHIQAIYRTRTEDLGISFLVASLEKASLEALGDPTLERAIGAWMADVTKLEQQDMQLLSVSEYGLRAVNRHPEVRLALARPLEVVEASGPFPGYTGETMRRLREDDEVMTAAGSKAHESRIHLRLLRRVRASADSARALVRLARANQ